MTGTSLDSNKDSSGGHDRLKRFRWTSASHRRNQLVREYEPIQPFFLFALAKQLGCKTFFDIGANVGFYSILGFEFFDKVIAIDAHQPAADELQRNIELNDVQIEVVRKAISDRPGVVKFQVIGKLAGNNAVGDEGVELEAVTLDSLSGTPPYCIKMDVEGHEPAVIAGGEEKLSFPCLVQLEAYDESGCEALEALGYERLIKIGPDAYYSNMGGDVLAAIESASNHLIKFNKLEKTVGVRVGDFSLNLHGRSAAIAVAVAKRTIWKWL